jgi:hypothetical protein
MRAWKAVDESWGGWLVEDELEWELGPLALRNAVHNPNWAWAFAGPVAGKEPPAGFDAVDLPVVVVEVERVVEVVELVDDVVVVGGWWVAEAVRP